MANSSKWGRSGSRETVQCFYCETETRLDNLERHSNVRHPGKPVKHKTIIPSNQRTLFQILHKKIDDGEKENKSESNESQEKNIVTELDDITEMDDVKGDASDVMNKITDTEKLENTKCLVSKDFASKKRTGYADSESFPEKVVKKCFVLNLVRIQQMNL